MSATMMSLPSPFILAKGAALAMRQGFPLSSGAIWPNGPQITSTGEWPSTTKGVETAQRLTDGVGRSQLLKKFRNKSDPHTQF
jgi:hypothetical protein